MNAPDEPQPLRSFEWFRDALVPGWLARARDRRHGGIFDRLGPDGDAQADAPKSTLVHARTLFTLSHLMLLGADDPAYREGAEAALSFLDQHLRTPEGGYFSAVARDGDASGPGADRVRDCYDHSFVLLALATYGRAASLPDPGARLARTWDIIDELFADRAMGGFFEDDRGRQGNIALPRRQNPHMHMLEALLFAYEATGERVWLHRADGILELFLRHFLDRETGTLREFLGPRLEPLDTHEGRLREPGHHFEWVWLLHKYEALGGAADLRRESRALFDFAVRHGLRRDEPMQGAVLDAVLRDGSVAAPTMLLWPQTEGVKAYAARYEQTGEVHYADAARSLLSRVWTQYFRGESWCNQIGPAGDVTQPDALSRLLYHVALCVTESRRVGVSGRSGR